jgi:hypothetical protein
MLAQISIFIFIIYVFYFIKSSEKLSIAVCAIIPVAVIKIVDIGLHQTQNNNLIALLSTLSFVFYYFGFLIEELIKYFSSIKLTKYTNFVFSINCIILVEIYGKCLNFYNKMYYDDNLYFVVGVFSSATMHILTSSIFWHMRKYQNSLRRYYVIIFCCVVHYYFNKYAEVIWLKQPLIFTVIILIFLIAIIYLFTINLKMLKLLKE